MHNVPYERNMENLHHKPDDAIDCLIIVGFPECEHDTSSDDKQNQEGFENTSSSMYQPFTRNIQFTVKPGSNEHFGFMKPHCVKVDDVAQRPSKNAVMALGHVPTWDQKL